MQIKHYIEVDGELKRIKDRVAAGIMGIIGGWFGLHKFYNGRVFAGIIYLLFSWTVIPGIVGLIEGILYLLMTDEEFDAKYNR